MVQLCCQSLTAADATQKEEEKESHSLPHGSSTLRKRLPYKQEELISRTQSVDESITTRVGWTPLPVYEAHAT